MTRFIHNAYKSFDVFFFLELKKKNCIIIMAMYIVYTLN
jgi:hypothetical protein